MTSDLRLTALQHIQSGNFRPGDGLDAAHEIAQSHEGTADFDWLHALVHRIEGDDWNADYWYRRCGKSRHPGSAAEEWQILHTAFRGAPRT